MIRGRPRLDGLLLPGDGFISARIKALPRPSPGPVHPGRDEDFIDRYRRGETLAEIGAIYGITRERVRQRLAKHGINKAGGGALARHLFSAQEKHKEKRARDEQRAQKLFGISLDVFSEITGLTTTRGCWNSNNRAAAHPIVKAYLNQRHTADTRKIAWRFNLAEWWKVWDDSGHWEQRGRGQGYCMARWADDGPYSPDNVYICTISQNFSDSWIVRRARQEAACSI